MKTNKVLKAAFAMILALILSFGTLTSAFAADTDETVKWIYSDEHYEYVEYFINRGAVNEGENEISLEGTSYDENECYTFDASQDGYYLFTSNGFSFDISEKTVDGNPVNYANGNYGYDDNNEYRIVYLPEGVTYIGIYSYYNVSVGEIDIEYLGDEIVDIEFDQADFENLIIDYDFGYGTGIGFDIECEPTFVFANGNEITLKNSYIRFATDGEVEEGENVITTANTFGFEKQITMTCYELSSFIEKIEISNLDKYLKVREYYISGDRGFDFYSSPEDADGIQGETLTVTLSDGTKQNYIIDWYEGVNIILQNGKEIYVYCSDEIYDGKDYFVLVVGGQVMIEKECEVIEVDDEGNAARLKERIDSVVSRLKRNLAFWFSELINPVYGFSFSQVIHRVFNELQVRFGEILGEIRDYTIYTILN